MTSAAKSVASTSRRNGLVGGAALALVSLALGAWGIDWGMPAATSWAADTVAGTRTLATIGRWPDRWPTHYPPMHFLINRLAYASTLARWERDAEMIWAKPPRQRGESQMPAAPGEEGVVPIFAPPAAEHIGRLIMISRAITVAMSVLTALIVAACGWRLFGDGRAGWLAGLTLATCAEWVFFSHLGNLDVPHMFWFAASLYAYIRVCQSDSWKHFALLGIFAAMSVGTKDAVAGAYVGMAVAVGAIRMFAKDQPADRWGQRLAVLVHPKIFLGLAAFALPYAVINGLFVAPDVYVKRMSHWLGGPGIADFNQAYQGPVWLVGESIAVAAKALGWPMLLIGIGATVYALIRWRREALLMIAPCIAYYLIVCQYTGMVYARMLFPVYVCLSLLVGKCISVWLADRNQPVIVRYAPVVFLYLLSMGYCAAVNLEMTHDTRYQAERFLEANVDPNDSIGVFAHPQYLPRFLVTGHRARPLDMTRKAIAASSARYLILTSHNYDDFDENQRACMTALLAGELAYEAIPAAEFSKRYLPPVRWWPAIAGWGTRGAGKVSPDMMILKRMEP